MPNNFYYQFIDMYGLTKQILRLILPKVTQLDINKFYTFLTLTGYAS